MTAAGLCTDCRHARRNQTRRGPVYLRCLLAAVDEAYPRYPRLPVLRCAGYAPADEAEVDEAEVDEAEVDEAEVDEAEVDEAEVDEVEVDEVKAD